MIYELLSKVSNEITNSSNTIPANANRITNTWKSPNQKNEEKIDEIYQRVKSSIAWGNELNKDTASPIELSTRKKRNNDSSILVFTTDFSKKIKLIRPNCLKFFYNIADVLIIVVNKTVKWCLNQD